MATYITLSEAKAHLRVDFTDDDAYIAGLIDLAEIYVLEDITGTITGEGSVATTANTVLTGTGSNFADFAVGDQVRVEGESLRTIVTITDDESLTVTPAFSNTADGLTWEIVTGMPLTGGVTVPVGQGTVTTNTTTTLTGTNSNFTDYAVGDLIYVSGETVRTIATITNNNLLTVTLAFTTGSAAHTFTVVSTQAVTLGRLPLRLRHAMMLIIAHYYMMREPVTVGVSAVKIPLGYDLLIAPYKNHTIA